MYSNRLVKLIIGTAIILAATVALQAFVPPGGAPEGNPAYIGMGDLQRIEAQAIPDSGAPESSSAYAGMGDLRRFEAQQVNVNTGTTAVSHPVAGMGDLHRFEAQQLLPDAVTNSTLSP